MRLRAGLALLMSIACVAHRAGVHELTPAAAEPAGDPVVVKDRDPVHRLASSHSLYFWENHDVGAQFTELRPDGTYRTIAREHMGVGEDDAGRWRQASNGELLLCSAHHFHFVQAGPLWIVIVGRTMHGQLPELRDVLRRFLTIHKNAAFAAKDIEWPFTAGEPDYHRPSINSDAFNRDVTRGEIEALMRAIDVYMTSGDENLFRTTPRVYRDTVYLDGWWQVPNGALRDAHGLESLHEQIEKRESLGALLAIDEATFNSSIHMTQPFVFHPEMNDCVGRLATDEVRDAKPERVEPRCRSFASP